MQQETGGAGGRSGVQRARAAGGLAGWLASRGASAGGAGRQEASGLSSCSTAQENRQRPWAWLTLRSNQLAWLVSWPASRLNRKWRHFFLFSSISTNQPGWFLNRLDRLNRKWRLFSFSPPDFGTMFHIKFYCHIYVGNIVQKSLYASGVIFDRQQVQETYP